MSKLLKIFSVILIIFPFVVLSQNATIRGFVYNKKDLEPVMYINVYLKNTQYIALTNDKGYFIISKVPAGSYTLIVSNINIDTLKMPVTLKPGDVLTKKLYIEEATIALNIVDITAEHEEDRTETKTSVIKITPRQIRQLPTIGSQPDIAQYLQVLPGVISTGDQGGQLYVRGGSPIQNKVLLDGMIVYNPFHSIGLFSVFDTDILRSADVFTGGFGAEYGDRISSVIDISTRSGNQKRLAGKLEATTFGSKVLMEGPLKKHTDSSQSSSSFIISAKNSYLEQTSKSLYKFVDPNGIPYNFTDLYGKLSFESLNGSKFNIFGFNYKDKVNNYKSVADFNWQSTGMGANFMVIPGKTTSIMEGIFAFSDYKIALNEENNSERTSEIGGFNLGLNFSYFMGKNSIKYGVEMLGFKTDFRFHNSANRELSQEENTTEVGLFVKYKWLFSKFIIEPSFRIQYYASLYNFSPEPRLAIKYNIFDKLRLKLATGLYSQNLISATYDKDVVNLFYGFLSGHDNLPDEFQDKTIKHKLQKADHIIFGTEYDLFRFCTFNLEFYYKYFSQLTNLNRNKIYDEDNTAYYNKPDYLKKDFIIEKGDAKGVDFSFKYDNTKLFIWAVYSLSKVKREDEFASYSPHYDRRHNINIVASYAFGKNQLWEASLRWNFGSGFPFTQTQGIYENLNFNKGINTDYTSLNGNLDLIYADYNTGRLNAYHRLDCNIKKKFILGRNTSLEANAGITNVYDRENIFYYDRITSKKIYQLPFMPSAGISMSF